MGLGRTAWGSEEAFLGSYSWYSLAADEAGVGYEDIARPILAPDGVPTLILSPIRCAAAAAGRPVVALQAPLVQFAGEATSGSQFQTTHGALTSGWREAKRLADPLFYDARSPHYPHSLPPHPLPTSLQLPRFAAPLGGRQWLVDSHWIGSSRSHLT